MNTEVNFCGVLFKNPVITASGTFNFGQEYGQYYDLNELGGITLKGLTIREKSGNPPPRIAETPGGILNSIGLQNPGVDAFIKHELPLLDSYKGRLIANIAGSTVEEYCQVAERLEDTRVDILEMNISCPNVKEGGVAFGTDAGMVEQVTSAVRKHTKKPLVVKLSPNVTDISEMARAAERGGADGISLINTLLGLRIDIKSRRPIMANNTGGLSGPAVLPVAMRMVHDVHKAVSLPIIGMGGISTGDDAVEMMLAGASLVSVGTASFINPYAPVAVKYGIEEYMQKYNVENVTELCGAVQMN